MSNTMTVASAQQMMGALALATQERSSEFKELQETMQTLLKTFQEMTASHAEAAKGWASEKVLLQGRIQQLETLVSQSTAANAGLQAQLSSLSSQCTSANQAAAAAKSEASYLSGQMTQLQGQVSSLQRQLPEARQLAQTALDTANAASQRVFECNPYQNNYGRGGR